MNRLTPDSADQEAAGLLNEIKARIKANDIARAELLLQQLLVRYPDGIYARALAESIVKLKRTLPSIDTPELTVIAAPAPDVCSINPTSLPASPTAPTATRTPAPHIVVSTKAEVIIDAWRDGSKIVSAIFKAYRQLLRTVLQDGVITEDEEQHLLQLRNNLDISLAQHTALERETRMELYLNGVREQWHRGVIDYAPLRDTFRLSEQERHEAETKEQEVVRSLEAKATVLIIEDDKNAVTMLRKMLGTAGYYSFVADSGEDAMEMLETVRPDIVLCDLAFGPHRMNGFTFYQKFRQRPDSLGIPFIVITGLQQESLLRTARKVGVDDYLLKPISAPMLISSIEGKLKRSKELMEG